MTIPGNQDARAAFQVQVAKGLAAQDILQGLALPTPAAKRGDLVLCTEG